MPFDTTQPADGIADAILVWCGVDSPTPAEMTVAELAASAARETINHYRGTTTLEAAYLSLAVEMGVYLYQKRGADGVTSFSENGIQRTFEKGSIPPSMLARITLPATTG